MEQRLRGEKQRAPVRKYEKPICPVLVEKGDLGALGWKWKSNGEPGMTLARRGQGNERMCVGAVPMVTHI